MTNSLLLVSPSLRSYGLQVAGRRPVVMLYQRWPVSMRGEDGSLPSPVFGFVQQRGGGRLSTIPCIQFYITRGRRQLSTVPCVRFFTPEGGVALFCPRFWGLERNWYGVQRRGRCQIPPPLSGGSKLNNLTCGVGKKEIRPRLYLWKGEIEISCHLFVAHQPTMHLRSRH